MIPQLETQGYKTTLMKPLLLHASARSTARKRRRVIHIEFSNAVLPAGLRWAEQRFL